jgi:GT2 family glycosyltransferase
MPGARAHLAVLITCHNRRQQTANCIAALYRQAGIVGIEVRAFVCDDGSDDGTREMLVSQGSTITILAGSGSLYWTGGMRQAFGRALEEDFDYYLWLNDDVVLYTHALARLLETFTSLPGSLEGLSIVVGTTRDPGCERPTYGGFASWPQNTILKLERVYDPEAPRACDTFNGNCVLIPRQVARVVGNLDGRFTHSLGDLDYGFRAHQAGCSIWVAPGYIGDCAQNVIGRPWEDSTQPIGARWDLLIGAKGLPPKAWFVFLSRYGGRLWLLRWARPYVRFWITAALDGLLKKPNFG